MRNVWPDVLSTLESSLKVLSDYLGDDHDLVVFTHLFGEAEKALGESEAKELLEIVDRRREELEKGAKELASRVFAERPAAFHDRMEAYWLAWRAEDASPTPPSSA